ncbi:alkaline shock response membrane anchor protein AmaP [Effusibacillus pohliae]|uniref:alkaline shock response membrane anchor protein AmaP n=1 Tax=Effusibacillus pohliae TaxID=232270 RepID=UPI00037F1610|nr:alkaline shock response membrane anchor protein AmaP [Effusibacillus pohliae]
MGALDRVLLFLFSAAVAVLAVLIGAQMLQLQWAAQLFAEYRLEILVGAAVLLLVSLRFLFFRAGGSKEPQSIVHKTEHGDVRISLQTLESLADRAARLVRGVSELKTKVRPAEAGVRIGLRVSVDPDLDIPQITTSVQQKVKDYVESTAGVSVQNVVVYVNDITRPHVGKIAARPRVE